LDGVAKIQINAKPRLTDATTVVPPGWSILRDERNNLLITDMAAA